MASSILLSDNGASSGSAGLKSTAGNDGVLILQTTTSGGTATNAVYVDNKQNVGLGVTPSSWDASFQKVIEGGSGSSMAALAFYASNNQVNLWSNAYYNGTGNVYKNTGAAAVYAISGGQHLFLSAPSGTAGATPSFSTMLTMVNDKSLALQGAACQSGIGITFPATQSASTDANTLDDYEEGTWTPTIGAASGSGVTYGSQVGTYVKIGQMVYVQAYVGLTNKGTLSGDLTIQGLPFTANSTGAAYHVINARLNSTNALSSPSSGVGYAQIGPSTAYGGIQIGVNNGITSMQASQINNITDVVFSGTYRCGA